MLPPMCKPIVHPYGDVPEHDISVLAYTYETGTCPRTCEASEGTREQAVARIGRPALGLSLWAAPLRADKSLGMRDYPGQSGTMRDKTRVCCGFWEAPRPDGDQDFCPAVSPHSAILEEGWTVLTPGKACLKGLAAITTNTTQATIQAQMKPSSSWWRCSEPSRSASSAVGAVFANVQTPRCSRSSDGWWPLCVREQV